MARTAWCRDSREAPLCRRSLGDYAIPSGLLRPVHRRIGALQRVLRRLARNPGRDAGTEGDHHLLVVRHEEFAREFALQAHQGLIGLVDVGVGEEDDEFLAALASQGILRTQVLTYDAREHHQCLVARVVAVGVVQTLEIVDVQQGDRQRCVATVGACAFLLADFFQATAVQRAGELIVPHQPASLVQLMLQLCDTQFGSARVFARRGQLVARLLRLLLDRSRLAHDLAQQRPDGVDVLGLGDALGETADAVVVAAGALGKARELVHEAGQHLAQVALGFDQVVLELALLVDQALELLLGGVEGARIGRRIDDLAQHLDLAAQPGVVEHQLVDVAQQQPQQVEQAGANFGVVSGGVFQPLGEAAQRALERGQGLDVTRLARRRTQPCRFIGKFRVGAQKGRNHVVEGL